MAPRHMCVVTYYRMLCICWECIPGSMEGTQHWLLAVMSQAIQAWSDIMLGLLLLLWTDKTCPART